MQESIEGGLHVPGFGGLPLTHELPQEERFVHALDIDYSQNVAITARELAMTDLMNLVTDQPSWSSIMLQADVDVIARWKMEAFITYPLISEKAWDWCMAELRDKALEFREKGFVRVLDTSTCVCKIDAPIAGAMQTALRKGLTDVVLDPYLHPLVYGETAVLDVGRVPFPVEDVESMLVTSSSTNKAAPQPAFDLLPAEQMQELIDRIIADDRRRGFADYEVRYQLDPRQYFWSSRYQCLPSDLKFSKDGDRLHFVSYINNLPSDKQEVYSALEDLISASVRLWNECLIKGRPEDAEPGKIVDLRQQGRLPLRIVTFGAEWHNTIPAWTRSLLQEHKLSIKHYSDAKEAVRRAEAAGEKPPYNATDFLKGCRHLEGLGPPDPPTEDTWRLAEEYLQNKAIRNERADTTEWLIRDEARRRRYWRHPEPGTAFTYEEWKVNHGIERAVVAMVQQPVGYIDREVCYAPPLHERYDVSLQDSFRSTGLQVIVKTGIARPTAEGPVTTNWRTDCHLNEHIVGIAAYSYAAVNVACKISFEQQTYMPPDAYRHRGEYQPRCVKDIVTTIPYDTRNWTEEMDALAALYGFENADALRWQVDWSAQPLPMQPTGSVELPEGRLVAFPSVLDYNIEATAIDPAQDSHVQYLLILLVDPHYRVCSTSNVAPQQQDWWAASIGKLLLLKGLPQELVDHILVYYKGPMPPDQAQEHQRAMQQEEAWLDVARHASMGSFDFGY